MNGYKENNKPNRTHVILLMLFFAALIISVIKPKSYLIWILEAFPIAIGVSILIFTYKKFRFTTFVYILILIQIILILIGAHYTYGEVPIFNWLKKAYGLKRNYYDRFTHFIQGFIYAFIIRELLIRKLKLKKGIIVSILVVCICLSTSAFYELTEWGIALIAGERANAFLGFQGDIWDTQWDMFWALIGSIISVSSFYKVHDRYIDRVEKNH